MDLHRKPFDEGTKVKLSLFRDYIREWLPVFVANKNPLCSTINIFDFFAGPGQDQNGVSGSPLICLEELRSYYQYIRSNSIEVCLYLNEYDQKKSKQLHELISAMLKEDEPINVKITNMDFQEAFADCYPVMNKPKTANFLFLDQNGVKHITEDIFEAIVGLSMTDFMFFISSSTINRFCENDEIRKYINLSKEEIDNSPPHSIHRKVCDYYRGLLPGGKKYYLAPFSIRKSSNIYGLIFGTGHLLGLSKFLRRCWKADPDRGEANFDIDNDCISKKQPALFRDMNIPKKIQIFEKELREAILSGLLRTNKEVFVYTLCRGFLSSHARDGIKGMISEGLIPNQKLILSDELCKYTVKPQAIVIN